MQITDWPEQNLLGLLYLIVLLLCCFGSGPKWVWAPVEALSAISLVSQYLVGVKAIQGWLFPAGCYGPHPTPGCNAIWAGTTGRVSNTEHSVHPRFSHPHSSRHRPFRFQRRSVLVRSYCAILANSAHLF